MAGAEVRTKLDATVLIAGQGALMDALARRLASEGIELVRATRDDVAQVARVSAPDLVLLGGDAASDRSGHLVELLTGGAFASLQPVVVVGGVSLRALGGVALRSNVAGLVPEGGLEPCARRVRELLDQLTTRGLEGRTLQQAVDAIARGAPKPSEVASEPVATHAPPSQAQSDRAAEQPKRARRPTLVGLPTPAVSAPAPDTSAAPLIAPPPAALGAAVQMAAALKARDSRPLETPATVTPQALVPRASRAPVARARASGAVASAAKISPFARTLAVELAEQLPAAGTQSAILEVAPQPAAFAAPPVHEVSSEVEAAEIEVDLPESEAPASPEATLELSEAREPLEAALEDPGATVPSAAPAASELDSVAVPPAAIVERLRGLASRARALQVRVSGSAKRAGIALREQLRALGAAGMSSSWRRATAAETRATRFVAAGMNRARALSMMAMVFVAGAGVVALALRGGHTEPRIATASLAATAALSAPEHASSRATALIAPPTPPVPAAARARSIANPTRSPAIQPDTSANGDDEVAGKTLRPDVQRKLARANGLVDDGHLLLKHGHLGLAEAAYMKALAVWPDFPRALAGLTRVHLQRKDGAEAVRWAKRLVAKDPKSGQNHLLLGDACALRGDMQGARAAWLQAVRYANATARKRLKA